MNARLRRIYASGATLVAGDCNAMKFGEKLAAVGDLRVVRSTAASRARGRCAASSRRTCRPTPPTAPEKIALVRTPEEDASGQPLAVTGPSIVVIH